MVNSVTGGEGDNCESAKESLGTEENELLSINEYGGIMRCFL